MFINTRLSILLILIATSLLGCGAKKTFSEMFKGKDNVAPPTALVDFIETATINRLWSEDVGSGTNELFIKLLPSILDQKIFIADTDGDIVAMDISTGNIIWREATELSVTGGPGVGIGLIIVGTSEGDVVSFSPETGERLWHAKVSSEILSSPVQADNVVIVRTIDGKIFALDALSGKRLWVYDRTVPILTLRGTSTPVIAAGLVVAGFDGGRIAALELKTGKLIWEQKAATSRGRTELERMVDIDAQPLIIDDIIYITIFQASVTSLLLGSGEIIWQRDISSYSELSADDSKLYITDDEGHVWALDRTSGVSIWKQEKLYARQITGPAVFGNKIIVGDLEGYLHWLDKETGKFSARSRVSKARILTQPIIANDTLFGYSSDGKLAAFSYSDNGITVPQISLKKAKPAQSLTEERTATVSNKKDKGSFVNRVLDIFTGDPDEDEKNEETGKADKDQSSK